MRTWEIPSLQPSTSILTRYKLRVFWLNVTKRAVYVIDNNNKMGNNTRTGFPLYIDENGWTVNLIYAHICGAVLDSTNTLTTTLCSIF